MKMCAVVFLFSIIFLVAFTSDNPYFKISKQDVELKIPKLTAIAGGAVPFIGVK